MISVISFHLGPDDAWFEVEVRKNYDPAPDGTVVTFVATGDSTPPEGITGTAPTLNGVATFAFTLEGACGGISFVTASTHGAEGTATVYCEEQP